jgi:hypothetical protein
LQTGVVCFVSNDLQVVSLFGALTRVDLKIGIGKYDEKG